MRLTLDDGKSYDVFAMLTPVSVGRKVAWDAFRSNFKAWQKGLAIPFTEQTTVKGLGSWVIVFSVFSLAILLLPLFALAGVSMKAFTIFTQQDAAQMSEYRAALKRVYAELADIKDPLEHQRRLKEEIAKINPYQKDRPDQTPAKEA